MARRRLPDLGIAPLTARSLILSALLGSHPPRLPARAVVALGSLFGIADGAVRTALSRMVAAGDVETDDGYYVLGDRLRRRQATQDVALRPPAEPWDGSWWFVIVDAPRRSVAERRMFRAAMLEHRLAELRPENWLRPANVPVPPEMDGVLVVRGTLHGREDTDLAAQLWDLRAIAAKAERLAGLAEQALAWLEPGDADVLADTFLVSVAAVRFLRSEPQLPRSIVGDSWPPAELRAAYDRLERAHTTLLRSFLDRATTDSSMAAESTDR